MTETLEKPTVTPGISCSVIPAGAQKYYCCPDFPKTPCITNVKPLLSTSVWGYDKNLGGDLIYFVSCSPEKLAQGFFY